MPILSPPSHRLQCVCFLVAFLSCSITASRFAAGQWVRHTIDNIGKGADGVRLQDVDGDGLEDIVTGWEESGHICIYFHPGPAQVKTNWPRVVVGQQASVEDAFASDLNGNGINEIISCHEGATMKVFVHRFRPPKGRNATRKDWLDSDRWSSASIRSCDGVSRWMYGIPVRKHGKLAGVALGSKSPRGQVSLLVADSSKRIEDWKLQRLQPAGWIMSIMAIDMDQDGAQDLVVSDRKGKHRGVYWLRQPPLDQPQVVSEPRMPWPLHKVGGAKSEVMYLGATPNEIVAAARGGTSLRFAKDQDGSWRESKWSNPFGLNAGKAVRRLGDSQSYVFSANTGVNAKDQRKPGVVIGSPTNPSLLVNVSGKEGVKFDRIEVRDLDHDGDLDIITCEEVDNLGVFWYENPGLDLF